GDQERRNLQLEAAAHVRVQAEVDAMHAARKLPDSASEDFLLWLHREFYKDAPSELLTVRGHGRSFRMKPGAWRARPEQNVAVGRHQPPASDRVVDFMRYFAERY